MANVMPDASLSSKVEIFISVASLPTLDLLSKSDPYAVLSARAGAGWQVLGNTETVQNTAATSFTRQFIVDYRFETVQNFLVEVFDYDTPKSSDFVGRAEFTLASIMGCRGQSLTLPLRDGPGAKSKATVTLRAAEVKGASDLWKATLACSGLEKKDWFGSSDPFLRFSRIRPDGSRQLVFETEVIKKNLAPEFSPVSVKIQTLCNGDMNAALVIECFDWNKSGDHEIIGEVTTSLAQLTAGRPVTLPLVNPSKSARKGYTSSGQLHVKFANVVRVPTFVEYLAGGLQLNLVVAIDYTGSNGDPRDPSSLHAFSGPAPNEYLQAISAVSRILLEYDYDKRVPVYGFGGTINGQTSHCFSLTFNDAKPEVDGVAGLQTAYKNSFQYVGLSGPTYFTPILQRAMEYATEDASSSQQKYTILLLITDGQMNDTDAAVNAIIRASRTPLSIIIVGVGKADFSAMDFLDSDGKALTSGGAVAERDIVQFVPFRKYAQSADALTAATLDEIPGQVVGYFAARGKLPLPPLLAMPVALPSARWDPSVMAPGVAALASARTF